MRYRLLTDSISVLYVLWLAGYYELNAMLSNSLFPNCSKIIVFQTQYFVSINFPTIFTDSLNVLRQTCIIATLLATKKSANNAFPLEYLTTTRWKLNHRPFKLEKHSALLKIRCAFSAQNNALTPVNAIGPVVTWHEWPGIVTADEII